MDRYANLEVRFVPGANPDLVVLDAGGKKIKKRIDLTQFPTTAAIHAAVRAEGFGAASAPSAPAVSPQCIQWRDGGECLRNPSFMKAECVSACRGLVDQETSCGGWARKGECERNPGFMFARCPVACGFKEEL